MKSEQTISGLDHEGKSLLQAVDANEQSARFFTCRKWIQSKWLLRRFFALGFCSVAELRSRWLLVRHSRFLHLCF